jgi:hypothetical protein
MTQISADLLLFDFSNSLLDTKQEKSSSSFGFPRYIRGRSPSLYLLEQIIKICVSITLNKLRNNWKFTKIIKRKTITFN